MNYFSKNLKALRNERGLSQKKLSETLKCQRTSVTDWETGRAIPHIDTLIEIANFFDISLDVLVREEY